MHALPKIVFGVLATVCQNFVFGTGACLIPCLALLHGAVRGMVLTSPARIAFMGKFRVRIAPQRTVA
jgi:hypothetical protein